MRATFKKNLNLGFTLAELLGVLIILAIVATIAIPIVNKSIKSSKEKLYNSQLEEIKNSAEKWAYSNIDLLPNNDGESITITIYELKKGGLLSLDVRNPKTGELLPNDMVITITFKNNNYEIYVDGESGSDIDNEVNNNSPILILNGNFIEYVEINSNYEEKGAIAKDKDGNQIEDIQISYQLNGVEVPSIDTGSFNTYTAIYSATSEEYTSKVTRTIVIRDTTAPDLIVPGTTEVYLNELDSFNLLEGVSATDNSGEGIYIETRGFDRLPTDKIVEYTACDSHNNCITKRRLIKVIDEEIFAMDPVNFDYTGGEQIFEVPHSGYYKFEAWGAEGGTAYSTYQTTGYSYGGKGAYTSGVIYLEKGEKLYIYVGGRGVDNKNTSKNVGVVAGGYNGGGSGYGRDNRNAYVHNGASGGGATDIRYFGSTTPSTNDLLWNSTLGLNSRIMVAAGGGGGSGHNGNANGGYGGTLTSENVKSNFGSATGVNQTSGNAFGIGGTTPTTGGGGGGAGGYYGGRTANWVQGTGGSSYVSGYEGCIAIKSATDTTPKVTTYSKIEDSYHYSGKIFENATMIDGNTSMPTYDGEETMIGNSGNGYAKITYVGENL